MRDAYTFSDVSTVFHQYHFFDAAESPTGTYRNISGYHSVRVIWVITGIVVTSGTVEMAFHLFHGTNIPVGKNDIIGPLYTEEITDGMYKSIDLTVAATGTHIIVPVAYVGAKTEIKPEIVVTGTFTASLRCFGIWQLTPTSGVGTKRFLLGE